MSKIESLKVLIIEDDALITEDIKMMISKIGHVVIGNAFSSNQAINLLRDLNPDIVLLDINLGGKIDGIDIAEIINMKYSIPFVFITSYSDDHTVNRAGESRPSGYIVKPFDQNDLKVAIQFAMFRFLNQRNPKTVYDEQSVYFFKDRDVLTPVKAQDIMYIKADDNYCIIVTNDSKHIVHSTLKSINEKLACNALIQCHRSYVVNYSFIEQISEGYAKIGSTEIPIGRKFKKSFFDSLEII